MGTAEPEHRGRLSRFRADDASHRPALVDTLSDFDAGFLIGILVGEGHFGGDARQPQITLRMHVDHAALFAWLTTHVPGGRLYGPYDHSGRRYYQWMARGPYLRDELVPLLDRWLTPEHSARANDRYLRMKVRYGLGLSTGQPHAEARRQATPEPGSPDRPGTVPEAAQTRPDA